MTIFCISLTCRSKASCRYFTPGPNFVTKANLRDLFYISNLEMNVKNKG